MAQSREMTSGPSLPLILNFTFPLLLGNLLQQTYSLVDAAIVGKFLGINALASVGASTSVVFFDFRILQRVLRRFRHSGGTEVRSPRLCDDAALCISEPEAGGGDVGRGSHCHQSALRIYPAFHAHTGKYF